MTDATQTAPIDAREASKSRVQTQESVLASLTTQKAASEPSEAEKAAAETAKKAVEKPKQTASERIRELIDQREEVEAKAEAEKRRADELEARLASMSASAKPLEEQPRPLRSQFADEESYDEALMKWSASRAIAEREKQQAEARAEAEAAEVAATWSKRQESAMKRLTDYAEVIGKSEVNVPEYVHQAILESEQGPEIAYFLALHPAEAKRIAQMNPRAAIKRIANLERDLAGLDDDTSTTAAEEKPSDVQKSKAPPPIEPVRSGAAASSSSSNDFESYRRKRLAEMRK